MSLWHLFVAVVTFLHVTMLVLSAYTALEGKTTSASVVLAMVSGASILVGAIAWVGLR